MTRELRLKVQDGRSGGGLAQWGWGMAQVGLKDIGDEGKGGGEELKGLLSCRNGTQRNPGEDGKAPKEVARGGPGIKRE